MDKRVLVVLIGFIFLFNISNVFSLQCLITQCPVEVSGECLNIGEIINLSGTKFYCNVDSMLEVQKEVGESCLNDYECINYDCNEGTCQGKFPSRNMTIVGSIWTFLTGFVYPECGNGNCDIPWEDNNNCPEDCSAIPGSCGDGICNNNEDCYNCPEDCDCGPSGGPGVSNVCTKNSDCPVNYYCNSYHRCVLNCFSNWSCTDWSDFENNCGTRSCKDTNNCSSPTGKPSVSKACDIMDIEEFYCGDYDCNGEETCETCPNDCGECAEPAQKDLTWLWILLIIFLIICIGVVVFFIIYNFTKKSDKKKKVIKKTESKSNLGVSSKPKPSSQPTLRNQIKDSTNFPVIPFNNSKIGANHALANSSKGNKFPIR